MRRLLAAIAIGLASASPARAVCDTVKNVRKPSGGDFTTIQAAVNALPNPIPNNWCINVDSSTYSEQVTVQNFTFSFSSDTLTIESDPALVSTRAAVNPPALSTAAFRIANASVTLANISVISTNSVTYGVLVSSAFVTLSTVNIDSGGNIALAGISLSAGDSVLYSSVTVQAAHGLMISSNSNSVAFSTLTSNGTGFNGLFVNGGSTNTIFSSLITNSLSTAAFLSNASSTTILQSTITAAGASAALWLNASQTNSVARSFIFNAVSTAVVISNSNNNSIILSTAGSAQPGASAAFVTGGSSNTLSQSFLSDSAGYGVNLNSSFNTVSQATVTSAGVFPAFNMTSASTNTISQCFISNQVGDALDISTGGWNSISLSTLTSAGAASAALQIIGISSFNTVSQSYLTGLASTAAYLNAAAFNSISQSTLTAGGAFPALWLNGSSNNTFTQDFIAAALSTAAYIFNGSGNSITQSTVTSARVGASALYLNGAVSSTLSQDIISNSVSTAAFLFGGGANAVSLSTITGGGAFSALYLNASSSNTFSQVFILNAVSTAAFLDLNSVNNTISLSTISGNSALFLNAASSNSLSFDTVLSNSANTPALFISASSSNTLSGLYVQGSTAATIAGSTGTALSASVLVATNTFGSGLWLSAGSVNLTLTSNTITGGPQGSGIFLDIGNTGALSLTSTTIQGSRLGLNISTQASGVSLSVASMTLQGLPAGTTAINFLGGSLVSTFTSVNFADPNIIVNVNASPLAAATQLTMRTPSGPRTGPGLAKDPSGLVYWPDALTAGLPAGCGYGYNVKKDASQQFIAIQPALNAFSKNLTANACVVVRDTQTYAEQVTVSGFQNNGFQLQIMADPSFVSSAPVINPPAFALTGFQVLNASVTLLNFMIRPSNNISYGVLASSANITISSVNVDSNGSIFAAGISLSSFDAVSFSSVTAQFANGLTVSGSGNGVSFSTFTASVAGFYGLFVNGGSTNTFAQSTFFSSLSTAAYLFNTSSTTIVGSTITNTASFAALYLSTASNTSLAQCFIGSTLSTAVFMANSINTSVSGSTIASNNPGAPALFMIGGTSNTISQSFLSNPAGGAANIQSSSNTIILSTLTSSGILPALNLANASSNTISQCVISNQGGDALDISNGGWNSISLSSLTSAGAASAALQIIGISSFNTVAQSFLSSALSSAAFLNGSSFNTISQSTLTAGGASPALYLSAASSGTFTRDFFSAALSTAAFLLNSNGNTISQSTAASSKAGASALLLSGSSANSLTLDVFSNPLGTAAALLGGGGNSVSLTSMTSAGAFSSLYLNASSSNTFSQVFILNSVSTAAFLDLNSVNNTISLSTMSGGASALFLNGASSNTVSQGVITGGVGFAVALLGNANLNSLSQDRIVNNSANAPALFISASASNTLSGLYIQGSTAVYIAGSTGTVLNASVLVATNTSGSGLWLAAGSVNLSLTSNTITGGPQGSGILLDFGNTGALSLTSTTISGARLGLNISTQAAGVSLSVASMTLQGLPAGTTAINFLGGSLVSTFTSVNFADPNISVNVNAGPLSAGTQLTMRTPAGQRTGPGLARDPSGLIYWPDALTTGLPAACGYGYNVKKDASQQFTAILPALNALSRNLTANACVVVRDTQTYAEQVTLSGFANNGFQLQIMADPSFVSSAPVVNPPAFSTAAFQVLNASVTVLGFTIRPTGAVSYGVLASSANVTISSVNVDSGGNVGLAGMALSSAAAVSYSSITVQSAHGLVMTGNLASASSCTMTSAGAAFYGLFFNGASSNTVSQSFVSNSAGSGAYLDPNAAYNAISQSTITSGGAGATALLIVGASNTLTASTVQGSTAVFVAGSTGAVISASILTATNTAGIGLRLAGGSVGIILSSNIVAGGALGVGILLDAGNSGTISLTSTTISGAGFGLNIATQAAGATVAVASMTFQSLPAGATALNILGGSLVSTFSSVNFADLSPAVNVNASFLLPGSRITMAGASGPKSGPCFQDDPSGLVYWPGFTACGLAPQPFTGVVSSSLTANWSSTFPGGTFYFAQLSTGAFPNLFSGNLTSVTFNTSAGFTSLAQNTAYFAQVSPNSILGPYTALGSTITPGQLIAPGAAGVSAVGISLINWTWSAVPAALGYKVYRASSPATLLASIAGPAFSDVGLATNTAYGITVAAFNAGGPGPLSLPSTSFTLAVPPSSTTALSVYPGSATLSWALNTNPAGTTAEVQRSTDNANFSSILTAVTTTYNDPFLQNCATYYYRVRNQNGNSLPTGFDASVQVLTPGLVPFPPTGLTAQPLAGNTIALSWNFSASTAVVSQYRLYADLGSGVMNFSSPLMVFASTETSWLTGVLPSSAAYTFILRTKTICGVEETAGVTARAPSLTTLGARRAAIKAPEAGKRIRGNSVSLIAELTSGTLSQTRQVIFQFRAAGITNWSTIATADFNHPNPAVNSPFVLHWDVSGSAPGFYDLRAVAVDLTGAQDPSPDAVTVNVLGPADPTFDIDESLDPVTGAVLKRQVLSNSVPNTIQASGSGAADPVAKIQLPAGALSASSVTLTALTNPVITTASPSGFTSMNSSVRVSLSNGQTALGAPANLTLSYPSGAPTDRLLILSLNEATGLWSQDFSSTLNTASQTVTGLTPHFSIFAIFASPGGPTSNLSNVQVYPVPFKPTGGNPDEGKPFVFGDPTTGITFDNLPSAVSIRIYTMAGRLVASFDTVAGLGKLQWDARNMEGKEVASGGYFAVISAPAQKNVVKRLMIIR